MLEDMRNEQKASYKSIVYNIKLYIDLVLYIIYYI